MESIVFQPLVTWDVVWVLLGLGGLTILGLLWRGARGSILRSLAILLLIGVILNPQSQTKDVEYLDDIVLVIEDKTRSQTLGDRQEQQDIAVERLLAHFEKEPNIQVFQYSVEDSVDDQGTLLVSALVEALNAHPAAQIAGVFIVSDGVIHDTGLPDIAAPVHHLMTGRQTDWDRRIRLDTVPAFGVLGENVTLRLAVEDIGPAPNQDQLVPLTISIDGGTPFEFTVEKGRVVDVSLPLAHGGTNILKLETGVMDGELTAINNTAIVSINGIRDRLRVLLVSGLPNAGTRTWRNLLKSDSSVDLVHFTILRPPEKRDGVPVSELSLIAFPTRELFMDKIDDFDLIIFDRFKRRGILPTAYLENVVRYVNEGGALLIAAGPDFAGASSISRSPLQDILPASPNGRVLSQKFQPKLSDIGQRHPVTQDLAQPDVWGPWLRQIGVEPPAGQTVLSGIDEEPLLVLDRVEDGRVALLLSDQTWLWGRNFEGGGPQPELLRRLSHWLMKEPELEEETLSVAHDANGITVTRRSLEATVLDAEITSPSGERYILTFDKLREGEFQSRFASDEIGLFRLTDGILDTVFALGDTSSKEFENPLSTQTDLAPLIQATNGGTFWIEEGMPRIREVNVNRVSAGPNWMGITPRNAQDVISIASKPLIPLWLAFVLLLSFVIGGWLHEARRP